MSMFYELMMKKKGMPSRYELVEYIESTGTQWIDTGLIPKATFKYKIKYSLNATGNQVLFGSRTSGTFDTSRNQIYFNANNNALGGAKTYLLNIFDVNNVDLNIVPTQNVIVETPIMQNENCIIENATQPIYLFALNARGLATVFVKAKMYYCQIYDNNRLVRNFVPVYDTLTNKYGMWESVQGKFYGNAGTGDFGGSIVGYTIVGSPTITDGVYTNNNTSDYLITSASAQPNTYENSFELKVKVKINGSNSAIFGLNQQIGYNYFQAFVGSSGTNLIVQAGTTAGQKTITQNTFFYIRLRKDKNSNIWYSEYSTDNETYEILNQETYSTNFNNVPIAFGYCYRNSTDRYLSGSIDLNETYIKINNKLWFNGQQA